MKRVSKAIILAAGRSTRYGKNKLVDPILGKSTVELSKDNRKYFKKERTPLSRTPTKSKYTGSLPSTQKKTIGTKLKEGKLGTKLKPANKKSISPDVMRTAIKPTPKVIRLKRSLKIPKKISANTISSKVRKRKK